MKKIIMLIAFMLIFVTVAFAGGFQGDKIIQKDSAGKDVLIDISTTTTVTTGTPMLCLKSVGVLGYCSAVTTNGNCTCN